MHLQWRPRHERTADGEDIIWEIPDGRCEKCGKWHRILPENLVPYKQYNAQCIEKNLSPELHTEDSDHSEAEPSTEYRWHDWWKTIRRFVEAIVWRLPAELLQMLLLFVSMPLKPESQQKAGWLKATVRYAVNTTGKFPTTSRMLSG